MKNYVYTDLSAKGAVTLEIENTTYEVTQVSASYACNEVPTAICMLAIGRNARTQKPATAHTGPSYLQMSKATIWFSPRGEYSVKKNWPLGRQVLFTGFFTGFAYRKVVGKVVLVARLIHWSAALGFSSCLTKNGHVANLAQLNAAAVLESLRTTGAGLGDYISYLTGTSLLAEDLGTDLWGAIKNMFCALSQIATMATGPEGECGGSGQFAVNDRAQEALKRIEGPASGCGLAYKWGVPLKMEGLGGIALIEDAVATAIGHETIESYATTTFLDKMIGGIFPMFGLAFVPRATQGLVIADVPALKAKFWREIVVTEEDAFDMDPDLVQPLRAVGVLPEYENITMAGIEQKFGPGVPPAGFPIIGGCYVEDSVSPGDGIVLYVRAPRWLETIKVLPGFIGNNSGVNSNAASRTSTTPDAQSASQIVAAAGADAAAAITTGPPPGTAGDHVNELFARYAHTVYAANILRGRSGSLSGKLRFDIAPGSIIRIRDQAERFIGAEDGLAVPFHACVQRVTVAINAEVGMAGTSFLLSHVRTEKEASLPRTSVDGHPLFGQAIHGQGKHGAPLIDAYEFGD